MKDDVLSSRDNIFKHLTASAMDSDTNEFLFSSLLKKHYKNFVDACEYVKSNNNIKDVSCYLSSGKVIFEYTTEDGKTYTR